MHNLFGFDMFFFTKDYSATAWGTKDLNFGGEIKFIDTLKYYQKGLGELATTLSTF